MPRLPLDRDDRLEQQFRGWALVILCASDAASATFLSTFVACGRTSTMTQGSSAAIAIESYPICSSGTRPGRAGFWVIRKLLALPVRACDFSQ